MGKFEAGIELQIESGSSFLRWRRRQARIHAIHLNALGFSAKRNLAPRGGMRLSVRARDFLKGKNEISLEI
jgi:hypothetical protein